METVAPARKPLGSVTLFARSSLIVDQWGWLWGGSSNKLATYAVQPSRYFLTRRLRQNTYLDFGSTLQVEEYGSQLQIQLERWRQRLLLRDNHQLLQYLGQVVNQHCQWSMIIAQNSASERLKPPLVCLGRLGPLWPVCSHWHCYNRQIQPWKKQAKDRSLSLFDWCGAIVEEECRQT